MDIIDLHCDALYKLWLYKGRLNVMNSPVLETNYTRLRLGQVKIQCFAIFIPDEVPVEQKYNVALKQVHYFYTTILNIPNMVHITKWQDIYKLKKQEMGAILTLEGVDCIGNDIGRLFQLYNWGVRIVGLTWNVANLAADGILEERGAGLTALGKEIIKFNNEYELLTDVSHLSENGFWDALTLATNPIASHSNSRTVCNHPRNLSDEQVEALLKKKGMIHIVYYPPFTKFNAETATISDLLRHIDHLCSLGGGHHLGLGSDFDGISKHIVGLEDASRHQNFINELLKYYSEEFVKGIAMENFLRNLPL